jgi:putative salt-induced outer membrane protein
VDTAESFSAYYIAKRALNERSYMFGGTSYLDDEFDGLTEQNSAWVGYGYNFIDTEKIGFEAGVGLGYGDTSELITLADGERVKGEDLGGATVVLLSEYRNKHSINTEFVDEFRAEVGADNTFIHNDIFVKIAMNDKFAFKVGILLRHNTDPASGADKTDTVTSFNLLYDFN